MIFNFEPQKWLKIFLLLSPIGVYGIMKLPSTWNFSCHSGIVFSTNWLKHAMSPDQCVPLSIIFLANNNHWGRVSAVQAGNTGAKISLVSRLRWT